MIRVAALPIDRDLRPLLVAMARQGIRHRVVEESGAQVLWVSNEDEAARTQDLVQQFLDLQAQGRLQDLPPTGDLRGYFPLKKYINDGLRAIWTAPVTCTLIALALLVALVSQLGTRLNPVAFLFYPAPSLGADPGLLSLLTIFGQLNGAGEMLRTLTPMLLHFGALHLVFDVLWLWYFGRMIEGSQRGSGVSLVFLLVVLVTSYVSNTTQYIWTYSSNFGGLSGVVYGLLGYIWMWQVVVPWGRLRLPNSMIGILILMLVLMEVFAGAWIATAAHIGGLVSGVAMGALIAGIHRVRHPRPKMIIRASGMDEDRGADAGLGPDPGPDPDDRKQP